MLESIRNALLGKYEVRKTVAQKRAFAEWAEAYARARGFEMTAEESGSWVKNRNLVFGNPNKARILITAHYDTCARLPFPNFLTPKCWPVIILTQILLPAVVFSFLGLGLGFVSGKLTRLLGVDGAIAGLLSSLLGIVFFGGIIYLMLAGPANPHTANDNSSGVALVLMAMDALGPRDDVAFVLFDNEEKGLIGSSAFVKRHPQAAKRAFVLNADCISDGETMLLAGSKRAMKSAMGERVAQILKKTAPSHDMRAQTGITPWTLYPSDQIPFANGVSLAAFKGKRLLYIDRIHTAKDTVFEERNLRCALEIVTRAVNG